MKKSAIVLATLGAFALTAVASTAPAEARHRGVGAGLAAGAIAGAVIAGAASSAYAWAPRAEYGAYDSYDAGPGYYGSPAPYGYYRGGYGGDQSQHGGQPYYQ
jgi:hypothetical protein